jgi:predicted carbohydrate-binding protein with CBM5 and CBM33 domain
VDGRDRQTIPDGQLCSGGIAHFGGLDLARADWPATRLRAGKAVTVRYRATIPHSGTFRMYVTRDGYDPTRRLRWADLERTPFRTATDPRYEGGAYVFAATMPRAKTGRHIVYTVWQNSETADTYYSCSDVVFRATSKSIGTSTEPRAEPRPKATAKPAARPATPVPATRSRSAPATSDTAGDVEVRAADDAQAVAAASAASAGEAGPGTPGDDGTPGVPGPALAGAGLLALLGTGTAAFLAHRRRH